MDYADLEVRILKKDANGYPVEITFNGEQEFPRGVLSPDLPVLTAGAGSGQDGVRMFQRLFSDDALKTAWANARGQKPQRRIRLRIDDGAPELHRRCRQVGGQTFRRYQYPWPVAPCPARHTRTGRTCRPRICRVRRIEFFEQLRDYLAAYPRLRRKDCWK
jgi:hypothetical protein